MPIVPILLLAGGGYLAYRLLFAKPAGPTVVGLAPPPQDVVDVYDVPTYFIASPPVGKSTRIDAPDVQRLVVSGPWKKRQSPWYGDAKSVGYASPSAVEAHLGDGRKVRLRGISLLTVKTGGPVRLDVPSGRPSANRYAQMVTPS